MLLRIFKDRNNEHYTKNNKFVSENDENSTLKISEIFNGVRKHSLHVARKCSEISQKCRSFGKNVFF